MSKTSNEAPISPSFLNMNSVEQELSPSQGEERLGLSILQCKNCRSIIGDTSSVLTLNRENSLITLISTSI